MRWLNLCRIDRSLFLVSSREDVIVFELLAHYLRCVLGVRVTMSGNAEARINEAGVVANKLIEIEDPLLRQVM